MLAPVASALGIDLIWFGVLICINMQTSFMHPPFGFALFYLRSIAPRTVKTSDIYMGAIPWLVMQLILVAVVIFWPGSVTYWLDKGPDVDLNTIKIEIPGFGAGSSGQSGGMSLPPMNGLPGLPGPGAPAAPPAMDLSQPPVIKP
jgi:hypothetical protein